MATTVKLNRCGMICGTADDPRTALGLRTTHKGLDRFEGPVSANYRAVLRGRSLDDGMVELFLAGERPTDLAWEIRGFLKGLKVANHLSTTLLP